MTNWKETTLGEVARNASRSFDFSSKEKVVFVNTGDVLAGKFLHCNYSKKEGLPGQAKKAIKNGDILFSEIRPENKRFALVDFDVEDYVVSTKFMVIERNEKIDPHFLYILLTSNETLQEFQIIAESRSGTFPQITFDSIANFPISLPSLEEQKEIAGILGSLDDKIELLREENKTLEATAQAIFKEWFVNFNFPADSASHNQAGEPIAEGKPYKSSGGKMIDSDLGEIPEGWRFGRLGDVCSKLASGGTPSTKENSYYSGDINWFSTKELQDNFLFRSEKKITQSGLENSSAKIFPAGSIVMAIYAAPTVGRLGILAKNSTFNQAACGFVADKNVACNEFIYLLLLENRSNFNGLSNGAAQQNLSVGLVRNFPMVIPSSKTMERFRGIVSPLFDKILNNSSQIQSLSTLRDTLLPKLMIGEINI